MVQIGFNLLVVSGFVTSEHYPLLDRLKALGYDGVEIPIFDGDLPHYQELGRVCRDKGLRTTFATIVTEDTNPLSPDSRVRAKARDRLHHAIDCGHAIAALHVLKDEAVPGPVWDLPDPAITQADLDKYVNPKMPPLHYAMCGCESMPGYPQRWGK